jgi:CO/xanthine dehydrogenase FAD-binding subunit
VRSRGTFGGSVAHADPAAEWPAVVLALDAEIETQSPRGPRTLPVSTFFVGPLTSTMDEDEVLVAVRWPAAPERTGAAALELTYRHGDYAIVGVVAQITLGDTPDSVADARVALFGVGATPIRVHGAERALVDGGLAAIEDAAVEARRAADPVSDATASAEYRRRMVGVYTRRTIELAAERARASAHPAARDGRID